MSGGEVDLNYLACKWSVLNKTLAVFKNIRLDQIQISYGSARERHPHWLDSNYFIKG